MNRDAAQRMNRPEPVIADRSAGVILAAAAGDALGAPHEFRGPLDETAELRMTGGGIYGWRPGEWTDDTQLALTLLSPLAAGNRRVEAVENALLAWFASGPRDVGSQTSAVLRTGPPLLDSAAEFLHGRPDNAPNGALVRIGPAALAYPGRPEQIAAYARLTTGLTHPHIDCLDASILWAIAIDDTIRHAPPSDEPWDFAAALRNALDFVPKGRRVWWTQLIDEACDREAVEFHENNGWVIDAFQAALSAIVHTPVPSGPAPCRHLAAAIGKAVRAGGDTDTIAAIAGSLLGARWGATAVPLDWSSMLRGKRLYSRPDLRAADLDAMARRAARGGRPDAMGWPGHARLVPHYLETFDSGPEPVELGGVQFGGIRGLDAALAGGADVVISLCHMGTKDVPDRTEHRVVGLIDGGPLENPNLAFVLADTADFIAMRAAGGHRVYVHCVAAQNRTPAMAAAFLARHRGITVDAALSAVEVALHHRPTPPFAEGVRQAALI
jgi:ADP-ribosyl-[dinitrogen reductase] hydrolase